MSDIDRYRATQGAFLVASNAISATLEAGESIASLAEWARLRSMVTDPSDNGQWLNAEPFGFYDLGPEMDAELFAGVCRAASSICHVKAAALATEVAS